MPIIKTTVTNSREILHTRPSGSIHSAISGIHIIPECFHLLGRNDAGFELGVECSECKATAIRPCTDLVSRRQYPLNTVHLSRVLSM